MVESPAYPLIGSIANSVGMGFLGNSAVMAVAHALGARTICAPSSFAGAHGGFPGRASWLPDPQHFRRDVAFLIAQRPAVIVVGFLPKANAVDIVAAQLRDYQGIVLLDPVIGSFQKGLFVSAETAQAIRERLLPLAHDVTPNRFEAEVLSGLNGRQVCEHAFLNGLFDCGPRAIVVTSFERDPQNHRCTLLFTNGYAYARIAAPFYPNLPAHGAGDVYAAGVATLIALGASPFAAALLATALCARAAANTSAYGGSGVDPVAALQTWMPLGHHDEDERALRFCERSGVQSEAIAPVQGEGPRLKFAPPRHHVVYG